jgi:GntR family transcriptional regulator
MLGNRVPIPLYYQLKTRIEEQIDSGAWKPGDRVPSEAELGEQFQVSRTTVRQALGELAAQGRLTRIQGKGTFVAHPRFHQRLTRLTSFTQDMQTRGQSPGSQILHLGVEPASPAAADALKLSSGQPVIVLQRLRMADGEPMALETACLQRERCASLLQADLGAGSLYAFLSQNLNIIPSRALQALESIGCPAAEARWLGVSKGAPVLHIHRTTFDQFGQPFEQVESFYRGDRYVFHAELSNEGL